MSVQDRVSNALVMNDAGVWRLREHDKFAYSDGRASEIYLDKVLRSATDLSSNSYELESHIIDWKSEYHLTRKRAQLLSGFTFDKKLRVLEVGCGCGAITRFLGENFEDVVSIEGNIHRASIARLRTKDISGVDIICAPFQKIDFLSSFDLIVCVGVYEYSGLFVDSDDPYDAVLKYFSNMLSDNGKIVIAIENQFGLKYFSSSGEDHIGTMFSGIEGYHSNSSSVRTFGKYEIKKNIEKYFKEISFYYPYPDYKLPSVVIDEDFLVSGLCGELVGQLKSRDYLEFRTPLFNEVAATGELSRNNMLDFFANSFLIFAGKSSLEGIKFDQSVVMFSAGRLPEYDMKTVIKYGNDGPYSNKRPRNKTIYDDSSPIRAVETDSPWVSTKSLETELYFLCLKIGANINTSFAPANKWLDFLRSKISTQSDNNSIPGEFIDCIWPNIYPDGDSCHVIDQEFVWHENIPLNLIVIRAIYQFLAKFEDDFNSSKVFSDIRSGRNLIKKIAKSWGLELSDVDFDGFVALESLFQSTVRGINAREHAKYLKIYLFDRKSLKAALRLKNLARRVGGALKRRVPSAIRNAS
jgi:SAM-dependent methyltransferase